MTEDEYLRMEEAAETDHEFWNGQIIDMAGATTITNPQVVIKVGSPSTEARDICEKFDDYRQIPSLQEYFRVSQDRARVQSFYRQSDGVWALGPSYTNLNQSVKFRSLGVEIPLVDIYAGVELPPTEKKNR
jgi:Uma2 family endonuclease